MGPRPFLCVPEGYVSHGPMPAVWLKGGTLSSAGGPCVRGASWSALLRMASIRSHAGQTGRHWFWGLLPEQKACPESRRRSLACRGETRQHRTSRWHESWGTTCETSPVIAFLPATPEMDSRYTSSTCKARTIHSE